MQAESVAVLVAHPDDETLWAGGTLLTSPSWSAFVWGACRAHDANRAPKFQRALLELRAQGTLSDLNDEPEQLPLADGLLEQSLLKSLPRRRFDRILTHSPLGEYTRHVRHEEVARAVLQLWLRGTLSASEIWLFAYDDDRGRRLPSALANADITLELPCEVWQKKHRLITDCYGFTSTSWEARATPRTEAFFRITDHERARTFLARAQSR